ncbi:hypothetical protein DFH07DRAFT_773398 [Mycena maculata]|uniref:Uncharacterized protein n=1 Tax=Mycena maculata TaxID=230809 RepID=A0AAD7J549_9AGAR|nr:hypothetical protein DFH07DRAFT_773398 [Mycena maculata]
MAPHEAAPTLPHHSRFHGHVRQEKQIFTVYYGDPNFILNLPGPSEAPSPSHLSIDGDFRHTTWVSPHMPYLALLPRYNPFHGPLFGRLSYTAKTVPLGVRSSGWSLLPEIIQEWHQLEWALRSVLNAMRFRYRLLVSERMYPFFAWPSQYGYHLPRRNHRAALAVALGARDAFLPIMAEITMMFLVLDRNGDSSWRTDVVNIAGVEGQWLAELESSAVGDMETERIGGIIDLTLRNAPVSTDRHAMEWLFSLVGKLPVSFYFCWGEIDATPLFPIPRALKDAMFFPDHLEIAYLYTLPGRVAFSGWGCYKNEWYSLRETHPWSPEVLPITPSLPSLPTIPAPSASPPINNRAENARRQFPPIERYSGQKKGEDIHAFMARRKALNEKLAEKENSKARSQRLARELHAAKGNAPGKKGARVFIWEEEDGFFIRRAFNCTHAADDWDNFTERQRLYDGFSDQWDLCTALAPDDEPEDDDDWQGSDVEFPDLPDIPDTLVPEEENGQHSTTDDLRRTYDLANEADNEEPDDDPYEPYHDMREVPHSRFGFTLPISPAQYKEKMRPDFCSRSLGDEHWPNITHTEYALLPALFTRLQQAKKLEDVPVELLDLRQETADIAGLWAVDVQVESLNGECFYVVRPSGLSEEEEPLCILLRSAATTLLIVRMGWGSGSNLQEIVHELLGRGIEFRLCFQAPVGTEPSVPIFLRQSGLGFRPAGYRPTFVDYGIYCWHRDNFFESPHGRAARFAGGVIGRLARHNVLEHSACMGPTDGVFETGVHLWDGESSTAYWDDALTPQEIDLICGAYIIPTGQSSAAEEDGQQKKTMSWWPKPNAFYHSGMNICWWSPDCERWFQKCLKLLENNQAPLWTQAEWKHKIRFIQKSRDVALANERIACEYLGTRLSKQ